MSEKISKVSTIRPALRARRHVNPAAVASFAEGAGRIEEVMPDLDLDKDELTTSAGQTSQHASIASESQPAAGPTTATTAAPSQPSQGKLIASVGQEKVKFAQKTCVPGFRLTEQQNALMEAVFAKSTFKSRQKLFEALFLPSLDALARQQGLIE